MNTLIAFRQGAGYHDREQGEHAAPLQLLVSWLMSETRRTRFRFDPLKDPSESLLDYLEGYASSLDLYPTCSRHVFRHRDMGLLVDEFWEIARELLHEVDTTHRANLGRLGRSPR